MFFKHFFAVQIEFNRSEDVTANLIGTISIKENTKT